MQKYKRSNERVSKPVVLSVFIVFLLIVTAIVTLTSGVKLDPEESTAPVSEAPVSVLQTPTEAPIEETTYYDEVTDPSFHGYPESVTEEPPQEEEVHISYYEYTEEEFDLLARLIYSEGGIESYDTMLKIGSVVMNRVTDTEYFPNTIREVIYQKNQFSVTTHKINGVVMIDRPADELSKKAAREVLEYGTVLPLDVEVFFEKSVTGGWVGSRAVYGTFDHTTFAYIYPAE